MIERKFVSQNIKEFQVKEFIAKSLVRAGLSNVKLQRTPLGEKITIAASRPGIVVGRSGSNITKLTQELKAKFDLDNPQIEIEEVQQISLDPNIVAEMIASSLERFGSTRFKSIGHKMMGEIMHSGALGVEILISGKIPSSRAKTWRFYQGYLKKCGDPALTGVDRADTTAHQKTGAVGIKVKIMPPTTKLPDKIEILDEIQEVIEEVKDVAAENKEDVQVDENTHEEKKSESKKDASEKKEEPSSKKTTKAPKKTSKTKPKKSSKSQK